MIMPEAIGIKSEPNSGIEFPKIKTSGILMRLGNTPK
jgi:hypothetical protein